MTGIVYPPAGTGHLYRKAQVMVSAANVRSTDIPSNCPVAPGKVMVWRLK